ncbi:MAG: formate dehydrogenase [Deltaproteobacteria bacterium]|nr:formate dehydrogenase [Deltaproteobacteria bacterium]
MSGKAFFIDTTLCTGCRGCQIACKQWNQLPATKSHNYGSYQNPEDLSFDTFKVVRFNEEMGPDNKPRWYFFQDQCRHCLEPACKDAADLQLEDTIVREPYSGAVLFTDRLKGLKFKDIRDACPYDVPREQEGSGYMAKCTMCVDRVVNGMLPACVKTCPTGTMNFGDRDKMVEMARNRLAEIRSSHPKATVSGVNSNRAIFLMADDSIKYHKFADARPSLGPMNRQLALKKIGKSLKELARDWSFLNTA